MKSISLLTMVVLPGTFISTLFAVPLFDWDASSWSGVPKPRFWFYWAITVPLTLSTLAIWMVWEKAFNKRSEELDRMAREEIGDGDEKKQGKKRRNGDGEKDGHGEEDVERGSRGRRSEESRRSRRRSVSSGRGSSITSSGSYYGGRRGSGEGYRGDRRGPLHPAINVDFGEVLGNRAGKREERDGEEPNEKSAMQSYAEAEDFDRPPVRRHTAPVRRGSRIGEGMVG